MAEDGREGEHQQPRRRTHLRADQNGLAERLEKLSQALDAQSSKPQNSDELGAGGGSARATASAMTLAIRILSEFVAAVIVGALIGWGLDRLVGSTPIFLIIFLLLGAAAGFWNVYRVAMKPTQTER
ncbi:MAG TPA: AtpZ/AtpI family protein [Methylocella sp.]|nr:AtpZ/AtpI family protein [Methylocella sp.]